LAERTADDVEILGELEWEFREENTNNKDWTMVFVIIRGPMPVVPDSGREARIDDIFRKICAIVNAPDTPLWEWEPTFRPAGIVAYGDMKTFEPNDTWTITIKTYTGSRAGRKTEA